MNSFFFVCYCVLCVFKFEFGSGFVLLCSSRKHGHGTIGAAPAFDAVARASVRVCAFFFFFFRGFVSTWLDSRRHGSIRAEIGFDSCRIGFDSCRIGPYRPYRVVSAGGQNRPETAEIYRKRPKSALNMARKAETCLLFFFLFFFVLFFVNQGIVTCFSRIF